MKFFKENSYDILRLYINQIGITIFSLLLYFSVASIKDETLGLRLKIAISIFAILFYFALLYTAAWDWGAKDKIRIDAGRLECKKYKGALMSLIANIPNFILAAGCVITMAVVIKTDSEAALAANQIFNLILRFSESMYLGVLQAIFAFEENNVYLYNFYQSIGYLIAPLLAILATHIGYIFGLKEIKLFKSNKVNK